MNNIDMIEVKSGNIRAFGYDEGHEVLYVSFLSGPTYRYKRVPKAVYNDLITAKEQKRSIGSAFMALVNGKFEHQKVLG